jgi:hypothetical protein
MERCRRALSDWNAELRILQEDQEKPPEVNPAARGNAIVQASSE